MRLVPVLILAIALSFAGCFGKSNNNDNNPTDGGTTPTSPTATSPAGTTPASGTTPTSPTTGGNTTTPTPVAVTPKVVKSGTVTWPTDCSTPGTTAGQGACTPIAVTIDPGYTTLNFTVTWSCNTTPACASNSAAIAAGSLTCSAPASIDPVQNPTPAPCVKTGAATPGALKITPSGDANMVANYKLVEQ